MFENGTLKNYFLAHTGKNFLYNCYFDGFCTAVMNVRNARDTGYSQKLEKIRRWTQ